MPTRTQSGRTASGGRFSRSAGAPAQRSTSRRTAAQSRRSPALGRRKPQPSTKGRAGKMLGGLLPAASAKKARRGANAKPGRAAGLAMLAGAAGLAVKNRGKLTSMLRRGSQDDTDLQTASGATETPPAAAGPVDATAGSPLPGDGRTLGTDAPVPPQSGQNSTT